MEDTYKGQVDNPLSLNRYTYTHNNPLRYVNPTGHTNENAGSDSKEYNFLDFMGDKRKMDALVQIYEKYGLEAVPREYRDFVQIATGSMLGAGTIKTVTKSASQLLRENMKAAGIEVPKFLNAAHHIVPAGETNEFALKAREILTKFKIDINDSVNGVFLPMKEGLSDALIHIGRHPKEYSQQVYNELTNAKTRKEVIEVLDDIKGRLLDGTFENWRKKK